MSIQNRLQETLCNAKAKTSTTKNYKVNHECSQSNCRAFDSTSSDTDIEERIRTKACRFFKAYPKASTSNISSISEAVSTNHSTNSIEENMVRSPNTSSKKIYVNKNVMSEKLAIPNVDLSSNSDEDETNNNFSEYHLVERQCFKSHQGVSKRTAEENVSAAYSNLNSIEISSTSSSHNSSSATEDLSEDHSMKNMPSTSYNEDTATPLVKSRPFKSYPEDPLEVTVGFDTAKMAINRGKPENYNEFRRRMLGKRSTNQSDVNSNMRRYYALETSDVSYKEKRKKNNMAAKRSRDARRVKEDELAIRCAYLEQENMFLKKKLSELEQEKVKSKMVSK